MSLFTDAVNQLHAALGESVSYRQEGLPAVTVDAIYRNPIEENFVGGGNVIVTLHLFEIALDKMASPVKGDRITRADGGIFEVQTSPTLDETRTTWLLDVIEVSP